MVTRKPFRIAFDSEARRWMLWDRRLQIESRGYAVDSWDDAWLMLADHCRRMRGEWAPEWRLIAVTAWGSPYWFRDV